MYLIRFSKQAEKDMKLLKGAKLEKKVRGLLNILKTNPFLTPPYYEKLVWDFRGAFSRRINLQHRLVYEVFGNTENMLSPDGTPYEGVVRVVSMWTHYGE